MTEEDIQAIEIRLLLEGVFQAHGYDFRDYAEASLARRLRHWLSGSGYTSFSAAQGSLLRDPEAFQGLVGEITVNVTEMFRDPGFFQCLREQVVPHLKTYPYVRIWIAGCASGEEAYSLAILLEEEGLGERCRIYATDIDQQVIARAEKGIYPLKEMQRYTRSYQRGGGKASFSDYYSARYDFAALMPALRKRIVFATHNLAVDGDFGEMHMVLCRNVMIYFKSPLKERVLGLFQTCIVPGGFLCLGLKETLNGHAINPHFEEVVPRMRVYRKRYD
jgi:chemotaxis protein methyltransferase CheR